MSRLQVHAGVLAPALLIVFAVAAAPRAEAGLGGDVASVAHDHAAIGSTHTLTSTAHYDRYDGMTADGAKLSEFVDRSGKVFAVNWSGPRSADLKSLLGPTYSARLTAAARAHPGNHHVLTINDPDLVVSLVRLQRGWLGSAHLPGAIPAGVTLGELH